MVVLIVRCAVAHPISAMSLSAIMKRWRHIRHVSYLVYSLLQAEPCHRATPPVSSQLTRHMASTTELRAQLEVAETQEAKARTKEVELRAALIRCWAARAEWSRAALLLRLQYARAVHCEHMGVAVPRRVPLATVPSATADAAVQPHCRPIGRPRIAGCFQCRFLARRPGRRGGNAHTCGGPASTEYQYWARVRATVRAQMLTGHYAADEGKKMNVSGTVKKKVKRAAGARR